MTNTLWPHQAEAIELACKTLADGGRATEVMACGTGKSRIGAHAVAALAPHGRRLVFAPTVTLLAQLLREHRAAIGDGAVGRVVAVCSEKIPGAGQAGLDDLEAQHVLVTTNPAEIAKAVAGPGPVTVLSTYSSVRALRRAHRDHKMPTWNIVIFDEAHRTVAGATWSRVHDDLYLPAERRLYMTATPRLVTGRGSNTDLLGMDEEKVFGPTIYRLGYSTAIELGLLAPYRFVVSVVTDADIRALTDETDRRTAVKVDRAIIPARMLAAQIAVLRAAADYGVSRAISYHAGVDEARHFAATLPTVARLLPDRSRPANVWAEHLRHQHSAELRHQRLGRLAAGVTDGLAVISNARLLSEGVDVPAVDAVLFADPRYSTIDIIQGIGRAVRLGGRPDKVATIIVPLMAEPGADIATTLAGSAFAPVWRVVRALRSHDDELAAELDRLRRDGAARLRPGDYTPRLRWLRVDGQEVSEQFINAITVRAIESATAPWEEFYGAATEYRKQHGDLLVPQTWVTDSGLGLGIWLNSQRTLYDRGKLRPARIQLLEDIGMVWAPLEAKWERGYAAAAAYRRRHGHLDVRWDHLDSDGYKLGLWLGTQRSNHTTGILTEERTRRLEALGIQWDLADAIRTAAWNRALAAATAYYQEHGHLKVPRKYVDEDGVKLGDWVATVKSKQADLPPERRAALTAIGMIWKNQREIAWERGYTAAAEYRQRYGHLRVHPRHVTSDGFALGSWIKNQRSRRDKLTDEQRRRLNDLDMAWSPLAADWQQALAAATAYTEQNGHLHPPWTYVTDNGFRLGAWLHNRRRPGAVTPEQRTQLNTLDPTWHRTQDRQAVHD